MKSLVKKEFGKRLKAARKAAGLTQVRLGELMEVDSVTVARWEAGDFLPRETLFPKLSLVLNRDPKYFAGTEEPKPPTVEQLARWNVEKDMEISRLHKRIKDLEERLGIQSDESQPAPSIASRRIKRKLTKKELLPLNMKRLREEQNLSIEEMESKRHFNAVVWEQYELGSVFPRKHFDAEIEAICRALSCAKEELFEYPEGHEAPKSHDKKPEELG